MNNRAIAFLAFFLLAPAAANPVFLPVIAGVVFHTFMGVAAMTEMMSDDVPKPQSAIGQTVLSVSITNPSNPAAASRVPTTASAASAAAIPAPSSPSVPASTPATQQYQSASMSGPCNTAPQYSGSAAGACSQEALQMQNARAGNWYGGNCNAVSCSGTVSGASTCNISCSDGAPPAPYGLSSALACSAGYTLSGSTCNLTAPRQAVPDQKQDYGRTGTAFTPFADVDVPAYSGKLSSSANPNDTLTFGGQSSAGQPRIVSVQALSSGGSDIKVQTQKTDSVNRTYLETTQYTTDSSGVVVSASSSTTAQQLQADVAGNSYTVTNAPASSFNPSGSGSGGSAAVQFPGDYSRQGEAAAAIAPINDKLTNSTDIADPSLPESQQFGDAFFKDTFGGLLGWRLPSHASTCPTPGFNYNGQAFVINAHCQLIADHWSALQAVMTVVWVMLALFLVLRA